MGDGKGGICRCKGNEECVQIVGWKTLKRRDDRRRRGKSCIEE